MAGSSPDPSHGNTWNLPYDHDPGAIAPDVVAFLRDRLGSDQSLALYRAFGRALLLHTRLKVFLEVYGPGDTGKTVLVNLLMAAFGAARGSPTSAGCQRWQLER